MKTYKEISKFPGIQAGDIHSTTLIEGTTDQLTLLVLESNNAILDGILNKQTVNKDLSNLPDAMGTINSLVFNVGIPERIEHDNMRGGDEVQAGVTSLEGDEHDLACGIVGESRHGGIAFFQVHATVEAGVVPSATGEGDFEKIQEGGELAENDGFLF